MATSKGKNFFSYLNSIFYKNNIGYDKKIVSSYLLSLWLSHDKNLLPMVNKINHMLFDLPDEMIFKYYFDKVPKGKRFIKWDKKLNTNKKIKNKIDKFKEDEMLSKIEIKEYEELFNKEIIC